jgi:sugar O-acyltransferase (sialic acid O-acetyltransferase NeuD family)
MPSDDPHKPRIPLLLIGGGGHALVVDEAARAAQFDVVGFFDDDPDAPLSRPPSRLLNIGRMNELLRIEDRPWIMGVGNLEYRAGVLHELDQLELGKTAHTVIHPDAYVSPTARIGRGVYIGPKAIIHARADIRDHSIINTGAIVEHECIVDVNAHVAPGAVLAGGVRIGSNALVGIGARILPLLSVGDQCVVGAGAVVTRSVVERQTVLGVPARKRH